MPWESVERVERIDDGGIRLHVAAAEHEGSAPQPSQSGRLTSLFARLGDEVPGAITLSALDLGGRGDEAAERIDGLISRGG